MVQVLYIQSLRQLLKSLGLLLQKLKFQLVFPALEEDFKKFSKRKIDISDASRPTKDKEKTACENNNASYVGLDVAYDGLAIIKNPANDWLDYITVEELNLEN